MDVFVNKRKEKKNDDEWLRLKITHTYIHGHTYTRTQDGNVHGHS